MMAMVEKMEGMIYGDLTVFRAVGSEVERQVRR
jgi:hypothetical protein